MDKLEFGTQQAEIIKQQMRMARNKLEFENGIASVLCQGAESELGYEWMAQRITQSICDFETLMPLIRASQAQIVVEAYDGRFNEFVSDEAANLLLLAKGKFADKEQKHPRSTHKLLGIVGKGLQLALSMILDTEVKVEIATRHEDKVVIWREDD